MSQRKLKREPLKERDVETDDRRGWLSHGLAALAISALGLAVAGSVALTTSAEPGTVATVPDRQAAPQSNSSLAVPAKQQPNNPQDPAVADPKTSNEKQDKGTLAFERRDSGVDQTSRSRIRSARVAEQALERRASLEQAQQKVNQSANKAGSQERNQQLEDTSEQTQENELRLIEEKKREAEEARKRAEQARTQSQQNQNSNNATDNNTQSESDAEPDADEESNSTPDRPAPKVDKEALKTSSSGGASPVSGAVVGAPFGAVGSWSRYHTGIDFRAGMGVPIRAVKDGTVLFAGNSGDWAGNHVAVKHGDGMTTQSSHMSRMSVSSGQSVKAGQVIGYVGQTGRAFGAHLHFELYPSGVKYGDVYRAVNPAPWLQSAGVNVN